MNGKAWSENDIQYLKGCWPVKSERQIATALSRSENAVKIMRYKLNLRAENHGWTQDDMAYLVEHWREQSDEELAAHFHKSESLIQQKRNSLGLLRRNSHRGKSWTPEDIEYLTENWGVVSIGSICKYLGRSADSVIVKKNKLGLGAFLDSGEYVTLNQLMNAVTGTHSYSYQQKSWVENRGMPIKTKQVGSNRYRIIYLDDFWKWAEKNRSFIDFSKMEPLSLGEEPGWVADQRRQDFKDNQNYRKDPWTSYEDDKLKHLLKQYKYGYLELSKIIGRSSGAIQRRICDLGLKERPIKADNHNEWTQMDFDTLANMIRKGYSYGAIGEVLGRSEKAVRGRVYDFYRTENADKVRARLKNGPWGSGRPELTVWEARRKATAKNEMSRLLELLLIRRNQLGFEPYWQRHMCMNWNDVRGCTAGCKDCDECASFVRIKPQYCVRCGVTFYEREENLRCGSCRKARRQQHFRKKRILHSERPAVRI